MLACTPFFWFFIFFFLNCKVSGCVTTDVFAACWSAPLHWPAAFHTPQIFIADRSPFSAVLYGANGHLLEPVIREHLNEVLKAADILVFTVYLQVGGPTILMHPPHIVTPSAPTPTPTPTIVMHPPHLVTPSVPTPTPIPFLTTARTYCWRF